MKKQKNIIMYTTTRCGDCFRAKQWFDAHGITYEEINIDQHQEAIIKVEELNGGYKSVPTIIFPNGSFLVEPTSDEMREKCLAVGILTE